MLVSKTPTEYLAIKPLTAQEIHNVFGINIMTEVIIYYHSSSAFPTNNTCMKAIKAGNYTPWTVLTMKTAQRKFIESEETLKRHMRKTP